MVPVNRIFSAALGDHGYLVRLPDLAEVYEIVDYIHCHPPETVSGFPLIEYRIS